MLGYVLRLVHHCGNMEQGLGRNATHVEAHAAKRGIALDQNDRHAKIGCAKCRRISAWAGAKHKHIATQICRAAEGRDGRCG